MRSGRSLFALASLLVTMLCLAACGSGAVEDDPADQVNEDWSWLEDNKALLDAKRAALAALRDRIAGKVDPEAAAESEDATEAEGEAEPTPTPEELEAQAATLQEGVYSMADGFGGRLAKFINDQQIGVSKERTEIQSQAIRMKSDEDMVLAADYIDRGGEYQRAIDIYKMTLLWDPDYEALVEAMARAETDRYMSEERLAKVKKNMTEDEVIEALGRPKRNNIREFDNGAVGWFYPKAEPPNTAAAVFFGKKEKEEDLLKVYKTDWEAVKAAE